MTYLAFDTRLERQVAIKQYLPREVAVFEGESVMPRSTAQEPAFVRGRERFLKEAQTLAKLKHPSIVAVGRYLEKLNTAFMVMDYEEGESLEYVIKGMREPRDESWVRRLVAPLLDALEAVHAKEFTHFDIKPGNIFLRADGTPVLLDFGAARSQQAIENGLSSSSVAYTPAYAPFEMWIGKGFGPWTDIYGLAAVFYHLVTLKRPTLAVERQSGVAMPAAVTLGAGRYDPRLLGSIDWGLRVDAAARPQSVGEWRRGRGDEPGLDLVRDAGRRDEEKRQALQKDAQAATTVTRPVPAPSVTRVPAAAARRRVVVAAGALVAVAAVGAAVMTLRSTAPPSAPGAAPPASRSVDSGAADGAVADGPVASAPAGVSEPELEESDSVIGAVGMVDASDERYQQKPDRLLADLRADARRQAIVKAVGIFVERDALLGHYESLEEVFSHGELIDHLADDARPRVGNDGLVYLAATADVRLEELRREVYRLSREQRVALIRAQGDPLISVAVSIRDAERGSPIERSTLAENVIEERIRDFGFRVTSPRPEDRAPSARGPAADFAIESEAKLKRLRHTLPASGITIEKYVLTSWTVKCTERATGEDIYFDNRLPSSGSWADEDRALQEIGTLIADAFSRDLFAQHLPRVSRRSRLAIDALPSPEAADLLRLEMVGLRSVMQVAMTPPVGGEARFAVSWYDQGPGGEQSFDGTVLAPLRRKLGDDCLAVDSDVGAHQVTVRLSPDCARHLTERLQALPASALGDAPAERLAAVAHSLQMMRKLAVLNPEGVRTLAARGLPLAREALLAEPNAGKIDL